ncbi:MAG: MerR family transcriptional regulator [Pygmaiobacter sp.]
MNKLFTICEISQLLNVSMPTLRFWEEKGLFSVSKASNRYRQYTLNDLVHIADVISYRNLGIPIKDVTSFKNCTVSEYRDCIEGIKGQLSKKINEYEQMYKRACVQESEIETLLQLTRCEFSFEEIPFDTVAAFDYHEKEKLLQYTQRPNSYVRYFDTRDMSSEARGIVVEPGEDLQPVLWRKNPAVRYMTFLIKEKVEQDYLSNVNEKLDLIHQHYQTRNLLAKYLLTATENGERIDYMKAYLEVEKL